MADAAVAQQDQNPDEASPGFEFVKYWLAELGRYEKEFSSWESRCVKIIKRYRDERGDADNAITPRSTKYNVLWSNVQTLQPAIYLRPPKPVVERRFLDKDTLARIASTILERSVKIQIEVGYFHEAAQKAVLDYLLCGRGVVWERYEPTYEATNEGKGGDLSEDAPDPERVSYERVCTDYVYWKDFRHQPARCWEDVQWVAKREWLTRKEGVKIFGDKFKKIPLKQPDKSAQGQEVVPISDRAPKACVWEIWDKSNREVIFISPDLPDEPLKITPDPLKLQYFWPCPKPLYATLTNDTLVPIPDFALYQDQAEELDRVTNRIALITEAIRVLGTYDGSNNALQRLFTEGTANNKFVGVANWAEFTSKMGTNGWAGAWIMPVKEFAETLQALYDSRERTKSVINEITGISDIVRGQAQGPAKTATEQRIKGQFATLRLQDRQTEVARFLREALCVVSELVAEQFSPELLQEMTGIIPYIQQELPPAPPAPPPNPMMGHNGGPPMNAPAIPGQQPGAQVIPFPGSAGMAAPPMPAGGAGGPVPSPMAAPQPTPEQIFMQAVQLLKSDKMRTFRIDIETDSTIEADAQADKEAAVELLTATASFLEKALPVGQAMPKLTPFLGQALMFGFRRFRAGRDVESALQQAVDEMAAAAKNPAPPPPSPEQIKAQADAQATQQKTQADLAKIQADMQADRERMQMELQAQQQQNAMEMQKMQAEIAAMREKNQLELGAKREELAIKSEAAQRDAVIDHQAAIRDAALDAQAAERAAQSDERSHELGMEALEAQTEAKKRMAKQGGSK